MNKKISKEWQEVLNVKRNKKDKEGWGLMIVGRVKQSFDFSEFSKQKVSLVKKFLIEEKKIIEVEIKHYKKWSPSVYHKNTYLSGRFELEKIKELLKRIRKIGISA